MNEGTQLLLVRLHDATVERVGQLARDRGVTLSVATEALLSMALDSLDLPPNSDAAELALLLMPRPREGSDDVAPLPPQDGDPR